MQSRYYDPANHRFINADTYASTDSTDAISCNMFAYCGNNPINCIDTRGTFLRRLFDEFFNLFLEPHSDSCCGGAGVTIGGIDGGPKSDVDDKPKERRDNSIYAENLEGSDRVRNNGYNAPKGGGGVSDIIQVGDTTVTFGHGGRHLTGTELSTNQVNQIIAEDVVSRGLEIGHFLNDGSVVINGYNIAYTAKQRTKVLINVGTYYILR